jgi:hypothetical protein
LKKQALIILAFWSLTLFISGCASISGFEEGRALGDGNSEIIVSANVINLPGILYSDDDGLEGTDGISFPNIDLSYKYGLSDKADIGGRITSNLNAGVFVKYQLVGDQTSQFAMGTGLELATSLGLLYNVQLPLNMTFYPSPAVAINFAPRGIFQFAVGDFNEPITYIGGNFGLLFGKKNKFGLDVGYYKLNEGATLVTYGLGGKFRLGNN